MDPKKLRKQYMHLMPHLNKALHAVQSALADLPPADFALETNLKPYLSIKKKMLKNRETDPATLPDLARGRLFFSKDYNPKEVIDLLKKVFVNKVKGANKKDTNDCGLEYPGVTDVSLDMDGLSFELQLMPMEYKDHQNLSHQIYDELRNDQDKNKLTDIQKAFLRNTHNKLFKALDVKSKTPKDD
jgi:hypothetical protein